MSWLLSSSSPGFGSVLVCWLSSALLAPLLWIGFALFLPVYVQSLEACMFFSMRSLAAFLSSISALALTFLMGSRSVSPSIFAIRTQQRKSRRLWRLGTVSLMCVYWPIALYLLVAAYLVSDLSSSLSRPLLSSSSLSWNMYTAQTRLRQKLGRDAKNAGESTRQHTAEDNEQTQRRNTRNKCASRARRQKAQGEGKGKRTEKSGSTDVRPATSLDATQPTSRNIHPLPDTSRQWSTHATRTDCIAVNTARTLLLFVTCRTGRCTSRPRSIFATLLK